jgi:hypothetical protein
VLTARLPPAALAAAAVTVSVAAGALFELTPAGIESVLRTPEVADAGWLAWPTSAFRSVTAVQRESMRTVSALLFLMALIATFVPAFSFCTLVLTRHTQRKSELATRAALGAAPGTLLRELLAPVLRAILLGAGAGIAVGSALSAAALLSWPGPLARGLTRAIALGVTGGVLCAALLLAASGATLWLFVVRGTLADSLRAGERATASLGETRVRELFTVLQIAASVVLLAMAFVLAREHPSVRATANPGVPPHAAGALLVTPALLSVELDTSRAARAQRLEQILRAAHAQAGVYSESIASAGALVGVGLQDRLYTECDNCIYETGPMPIALIIVPMHSVGPDYFTLTGAPLLRGRDFQVSDGMRAEPVVIVNDAFARRMFGPQGNGLGRVVRLRTGFGEAHSIIGVVADTPGHAPGAPPANRPAIYFSALQHPPLAFDLVRQSSTSPGVPPAPARGLQWSRSARLQDVRAEARVPLQLAARAVRGLALLCFLLGAYGLYATTSTLLQGRRRDLTIRMALGCTARGLMRHVAGYSLRLAFVGLLLGAIGALAAQRILETVLASARIDARVWLLLAALFTLITLSGAAGPARQAARIGR